MFNRQPFNKGKFNKLAFIHKSVYFNGSASGSLEAANCVITAVRALKGNVDTVLYTSSNLNFIKAMSGSADAVLIAGGLLNIVRDIKGNAAAYMLTGGNIVKMRNLGDAYDITANGGFNRLLFNRGKFNASSCRNSKAILNLGATGSMNSTSTFIGNANIEMHMNGRANFVNTFRGQTELCLLTDGKINAVFPFMGSSKAILSASGTANVIRAVKGVADIILEVTNMSFNTYRYEYIKLPEIVIKPGDELIINTDDMTVTLNGQNVIQYLNRDSEFFLFNPFENDIIYTSGSANGKADIKILWKDSYL